MRFLKIKEILIAVLEFPITTSLILCIAFFQFRFGDLGKLITSGDSLSSTFFKQILFWIIVVLLFLIEYLTSSREHKFNIQCMYTEGVFKRVFPLGFLPAVTYLFFHLLPGVLNVFKENAFSNIFFHFFRVLPLYPVYADTRTTIEGMFCPNISSLGQLNSCSGGVSYLYPSMWFHFNRFDTLPNQNVLVTSFGLGLAVVFFAVLLLLGKRLSNFEILAASTLIATPAFSLVTERANWDLLILILFCWITLILQDYKYWENWVCFGLVLASFLKFFPIISLLLICPFLFKKTGHRIRFLITPLVCLLLLVKDILNSSSTSSSDLKGSFGLLNLLSLLQNEDFLTGFTEISFVTWLLIIFLLFFFLVSTLLFNSSIELNHSHDFIGFISIVFSVNIFVLFFITSSYYYKLIILNIFFILSLRSWSGICSKLRIRLALYLLVLNWTVFETFAIVHNIVLLFLISSMLSLCFASVSNTLGLPDRGLDLRIKLNLRLLRHR